MKKFMYAVKVALAASILTGCWGAAWPSRGMTVDLKRANVSYTEAAKRADEFLLSHEFKRAGKGGYDAINNTTTILDYEGPERLFVSIGPDGTMDLSRVEKVLIKFNQDQKSFSAKADQTFESMMVALTTQWPGTVEEKRPRSP